MENKSEIISHADSTFGGLRRKKQYKKLDKNIIDPIIVDVIEFINRCETCQHNKPGTQKSYFYPFHMFLKG